MESSTLPFQFDAVIPDTSSFTALLELPSPQALELLVNEDFPLPPPIFPSDIALIDRASKFSVFASKSPLTVKQEPLCSQTLPISSSSNHTFNSAKRKDRDKKVKESSKKTRKLGNDDDRQKLPYVHVRARRGQATDSHSLAERARREKINARMKLLQELVPGCDKISGTAMVLDEIINHVQALQRQVEFLSMRLAAVDPRIDFSLDTLMAADGVLSMDNGYIGMFGSLAWAEGQTIATRQVQHPQVGHCHEVHPPASWGREEEAPEFINPDRAILSYNSTNSGREEAVVLL